MTLDVVQMNVEQSLVYQLRPFVEGWSGGCFYVALMIRAPCISQLEKDAERVSSMNITMSVFTKQNMSEYVYSRNNVEI